MLEKRQKFPKDRIYYGNRIIAEYMGAEVHQAYSEMLSQSGEICTFSAEKAPDIFKTHSISCLKYHKSWDWLMPVLVKMEFNKVNPDITYMWDMAVLKILLSIDLTTLSDEAKEKLGFPVQEEI